MFLRAASAPWHGQQVELGKLMGVSKAGEVELKAISGLYNLCCGGHIPIYGGYYHCCTCINNLNCEGDEERERVSPSFLLLSHRNPTTSFLTCCHFKLHLYTYHFVIPYGSHRVQYTELGSITQMLPQKLVRPIEIDLLEHLRSTTECISSRTNSIHITELV